MRQRLIELGAVDIGNDLPDEARLVELPQSAYARWQLGLVGSRLRALTCKPTPQVRPGHLDRIQPKAATAQHRRQRTVEQRTVHVPHYQCIQTVGRTTRPTRLDQLLAVLLLKVGNSRLPVPGQNLPHPGQPLEVPTGRRKLAEEQFTLSMQFGITPGGHPGRLGGLLPVKLVFIRGEIGTIGSRSNESGHPNQAAGKPVNPIPQPIDGRPRGITMMRLLPEFRHNVLVGD
ncbi:hypothetical protein V6U90_14310 [Micromonospora sp. CPCC 206060]